MTAFRLGLVVVGTLVFAQINEWQLLDQLTIALVALLVLAYVWSRVSVTGVGATRRISTVRAQVGQTVSEEVIVENRARLGKLWLEIRDFSTLPGHHASRVLHLGGRQRRSWVVETVCARRGRYRTGPLIARAGDPFGIFPTAKALPVQFELVVYPAAVDLKGFSLPVGMLSGGTTTDRRTPILTPSVAGIRDYVPSDAFNRISWTATARLGRLMVKEFDVDPTSDVWLVLDLDRQYSVRSSQTLPVATERLDRWPVEVWLDATEEYAVTITASLARRCLEQGRSFGMIATAAHYEVLPAERSDRQYVKILEALAVIEADGHRRLAEVLVAETRRFTRHSGLIVVTSSWDLGWVAALAELTGRRVKATAIVVDPASFGPAPPVEPVVDALHSANVPVHVVRYGDDIATALAVAGGIPVAANGKNAHG
ncbi:MAG: hypothetical protein QOF73_1635 [Thermomicrobiales bacterium]|jgi:uncharacterized protein (DUF58 family)|nr:hypothetical protein [Thermomicrobiales bacterium]